MACLLSTLGSGCAGPVVKETTDLPLAGMDDTREVPVGLLASAPSGLAEQQVRTRAHLVRGGRLPEGAWVELAPVQQPGKSAVLLIPDDSDAERLLGYAGQVVTLSLRIHGPKQLSDGRAALSATALQYAARFGESPPGSAATELQQEIDRQAAAAPATAHFLLDPGLPTSTSEPRLRVTFLDPQLDRPRFSVPQAVSITRSGSPDAPRYRFQTTSHAENGQTRESVCHFELREGKLRSLSLDEITRDASERVLEERHVDFTGTYIDKISGHELPFPENIYPSPCLGLVLSGFPFEHAKLLRFSVWSDLDPATPMIAMVDEPEEVSTPAGTFTAYRVRMRFDEEAFLAGLVLPAGHDIARSMVKQLRLQDGVFWMTKDEPHLIVKSEGPLGPPGVTRGVIEMLAMPKSVPQPSTPSGR
jgi:hypothetical protein